MVIAMHGPSSPYVATWVQADMRPLSPCRLLCSPLPYRSLFAGMALGFVCGDHGNRVLEAPVRLGAGMLEAP